MNPAKQNFAADRTLNDHAPPTPLKTHFRFFFLFLLHCIHSIHSSDIQHTTGNNTEQQQSFTVSTES
jgi:hypothetical protein